MDNLKDWKGVALMCDGYSGYDWLKKINGRILCRCVVHARRPMERALKENPNMAKIGILFYQNINLIEEMIKEKKLEGEEKAQFRKDYAEPLWAASAILDVPKDSNIYQALNYMLRNYTELTNYIDIPDMPLDNDETDTILVATGDTNKFEVVCADTGIGMVTSLAPVLKNSPSLRIRNYDVLEMATMQGITSKKGTDHMGFGFWLISEFVRIAKGEIHIYSEGAYYVNQCGKIKKGTCGFWQGTIIYVSLPLNKANEIKIWQDGLAEQYQDIKINCV